MFTYPSPKKKPPEGGRVQLRRERALVLIWKIRFLANGYIIARIFIAAARVDTLRRALPL